jgi:DNA-binding MarR family transcriptional regulator
MIDRAKEGAKFTRHSRVSAMGRAIADPSESGPFRLAGSASHLLHRAEQMAAERFTQLVGDTVTLRQFAVLTAIADIKGGNLTELARITGIDRSTLAEMLKRMQERGWITRATSKEDGRVQSIHLAGTGSMILAASTQHARAADAAVLDALGKAKGRSFLTLLALLAEKADKIAAKAERDARKQAKREAKERAKVRAKEKAKLEKEKAKEKKPEEKKPGKREARKPRGAS